MNSRRQKNFVLHSSVRNVERDCNISVILKMYCDIYVIFIYVHCGNPHQYGVTIMQIQQILDRLSHL